MGGGAEWLREYYSLQPSNLIAEYMGRRRSRGRLQDRDYLPTKEARARARARAVICRLLNYRNELCKSRRRCYEISQHSRDWEGGGVGGERTKAAASVGVNTFVETPTFDPELFDPKEIRKARGCVLRGRLNYCGELCRSRNEMKFCTTRAKSSGGEKAVRQTI